MLEMLSLHFFSTNETIIKKSQQENGRAPGRENEKAVARDLWRQPCLFPPDAGSFLGHGLKGGTPQPPTELLFLQVLSHGLFPRHPPAEFITT